MIEGAKGKAKLMKICLAINRNSQEGYEKKKQEEADGGNMRKTVEE